MRAMVESTGPVASVIISIAVMLFCGFLMTRITKLLRLPNVTAYIVVGILIGPYVLDVIPTKVIDGMEFLPDIALSFIAFSTGEFFRLSTLKKNGMKVVIIGPTESFLPLQRTRRIELCNQASITVGIHFSTGIYRTVLSNSY